LLAAPAVVVAVVVVMLIALAEFVSVATAATVEIIPRRPRNANTGTTLMDANLGFFLDLPPGFVPAPDVLQRNPGVIHAYAYGRRDSNGIAITLTIERLGRTLRREHLQVPKDVVGEIVTTDWNGFAIDAMLIQKTLANRTYISYIVRIPLKREAIQLELAGPAARKDEVDALLRKLLDGLSGESNWEKPTMSAPGGGAGAASAVGGSENPLGVSSRTVLICVTLVGIAAIIPLFWPRNRSGNRCVRGGAFSSARMSSTPPPLPPPSPPPLPPVALSTPPGAAAVPPPLPPRLPNP
jgi:hypothetical protein